MRKRNLRKELLQFELIQGQKNKRKLNNIKILLICSLKSKKISLNNRPKCLNLNALNKILSQRKSTSMKRSKRNKRSIKRSKEKDSDNDKDKDKDKNLNTKMRVKDPRNNLKVTKKMMAF